MKKVLMIYVAMMVLNIIPMLTSCSSDKRKEALYWLTWNEKPRRTFYTCSEFVDDPRFPLIYPFDMVKPDCFGWSINVGQCKQDDIVEGERYIMVDLVYCDSNMIYCHNAEHKGGDGIFPSFPQPERWFTIDLHKMHLTLYKDSFDFYSNIGDEAAEHLQHPDEYFAAFDSDVFALPWIPDTVVW